MENNNTNKIISLAEKLSHDIIDYILLNNMKEGDKLPNEYELGEIFKTGRGTVREAIKILTSKNIVEIKRGDGTYISDKKGVSDDPLGLKLLQNNSNLAEDLMAVRFMIEPQIAAIAAKNATKEDILLMEKLCTEVEKQIKEEKNHMKKDIEFHTCIAMSSKNSIVPNLVPIINRSIVAFIDITNRSLIIETISSHREIFEAIKKHDSIAAQDAMYLHLVYNRRAIHMNNQS